MTDHDDHDDYETQALADDEPSEAENEAKNAALQARIAIRGMLDEVQGAISRSRAPGLARVEAASHVQVALSYLGTSHLGQSAIHAAWGMAYMDVAAKRSKLPAAIVARWAEVRAALPPSMQESMGKRQRAARPVTPPGQGEQRRGA